MPAISTEHVSPPLTRQSLASPSSEMSFGAQCLGRHISLICNSTDAPHWKVRGQELQQCALSQLQPINAWSARASIAPLKKTLSDCLLAVSGIGLNTFGGLFSQRTLSTLPTHISGLVRQLTPWDFSGAQALPVAGTAAQLSHTSSVPPYMTQHFQRVLQKVLIRHHYLDAGQIARLDDRQLVAALLRFLRDIPVRAAQMLVRNIQKMQASYGAHPGESISAVGQDAIVLHWLERAVFKASISDVLLSALHASNTANATTADLPRLLKSASGLQQSSLNQWIWQYLVQRALPILQPTTMDGNTDLRWEDALKLRLADFEWGKIHAGLMFANAISSDNNDLSMVEAMDLGSMLLAQLQEGAAPLEWWRFFELPAKLRYLLTRETLEHIETDAISAYTGDYALLQQQNCPIQKFKVLMESYQTRPQLARQVIKENCPELRLDDYLNYPGDYLGIYCGPDGTLHQLENITQRYQRQIDEIGDAYEKIAPLLLSAAWGQLSQEEINFLIHAKITSGKAHFAANDVLPIAGLFFFTAHRERLTIPLKPGVELFAATSIGDSCQERIYALQRQQNGYQVSRIDRNPQAYLALTDPERKTHYRENRFTLHIDISKTEELKHAGDKLLKFMHNLATAHRVEFAQQLYDLGYEKTSLEKIADFALSMLPFYTCIKASSAGQTEESIIACSIDIVTLLPVLGGLSRLSIKFGQALTKGGVLAAQHTISDWAVRGSLQAILGQSGKHFMRYAIWPAAQTIGRQDIRSLASAILRSLDPGVELMALLGRGTVSQALRLGSSMRQALPSLRKTLPRLESTLHHLPTLPLTNNIIYAKLAGASEAQAIIRLDGARYLNKHDIYIRINPDSGEVFGKKYYFAEDARLTAVPFTTAQRLHNIRQQGLGGNGGRYQSRIWSQQAPQPIPLSYIVLYRLARLHHIDFEISGGVRGIARAMNTRADLLQQYFNIDGTLTELAQMRLKYCPPCSASTESIPLLYRFATAQDIVDWNRLKHNPDNSVTKQMFAAVRNIHPDTWQKLVTNKMKVHSHIGSAHAYQNSIAAKDIYEWMRKTPQERLGNSGKFAIARGIAPSTFSKFISQTGELTRRGKRRFGFLIDDVTMTPYVGHARESNAVTVANAPASANDEADNASGTLLRQALSRGTAGTSYTEPLNLARQHHVPAEPLATVSGTLLRQLQSLHTVGASHAELLNIAKQHRVTAAQLSLYITETGQLTPKGKKRIAMDEFASHSAT
jgi:hypothetical protein